MSRPVGAIARAARALAAAASGLAVVIVAGIVAATAATAPREPLALGARVVRSGELRGFVTLRPTLYKTAHGWVTSNFGPQLTPSAGNAFEVRLRRDGFRLALVEHLVPKSGTDRAGLSWVVQFRSASGASAEIDAVLRLAARVYTTPDRSYREFPVRDLPGARGFHDTRPGVTGENVVFSDGPFLYLVGNAWATGTPNPPARTRLLRAAMSLYTRVRGRPPA